MFKGLLFMSKQPQISRTEKTAASTPHLLPHYYSSVPLSYTFKQHFTLLYLFNFHGSFCSPSYIPTFFISEQHFPLHLSNILNFSLLGDLWGFGMFLYSNLLLWPLLLHNILLLSISFLVFNLLWLLLTCPTYFLLLLPHFLSPLSVQIVSKFWYILQKYCHFQYYDHCQYTGGLKLIFSRISIYCMVWCYY